MPRPLVFGNGRLFVGFDASGSIRDLSWPQIGRWNHLSGRPIQAGIFVDGHMSWLGDEGWERTLRFENGTGVGQWRATHRGLGLSLVARIALDPETDVLAMLWRIHDLSGHPRDVRLIVSEALRMMESDIGDTALFHAATGTVVHFKGPCAIAFAAESEEGGIDQYACGMRDFEGAEGTWRDAEDGRLSMNAIAQGSVDATFSLSMHLPRHGTTRALIALAAGPDLETAARLAAKTRTEGFGPLMLRAAKASIELGERVAAALAGCPPDVIRFAVGSARMIQSHLDGEGAVLAAMDSDIMETNRANYAYCWPRDGAHVAMAMLDAGFPDAAGRFLAYCSRILPAGRAAFLQKYTVDGHFGATWHPWVREGRPETPIQQDETASVVACACAYLESSETAYRSQALELAHQCGGFLTEFVDVETGLPLPSYDLWEERYGVHTYTVATVQDALRRIVARPELLALHSTAQACLSTMEAGVSRLASNGVLGRRLDEHGVLDATPDASILAALAHGLEGDFSLDATLAAVLPALQVRSGVGGLARNTHDYYFRRSDAYPGNPWFITTLWAAQIEIQRAASRTDLEAPLAKLRWCLAWASESGYLAEQLHPETGEPLSVSPLTWSHAEFLRTALAWSRVFTRLERPA